ncbi:DNA-processing protein DprA [Thermodesulfitimonas sp.]
MEVERDFYLAWQLLLPGQSRRLHNLLAVAGSPREAFALPFSRLATLLGEKEAAELVRRRDALDIERELGKLKQAGAGFVTLADEDYPAPLREIPDPPAALFYRGSLVAGEVAVAIVGTRRCSHYGRVVAEELAGEIAGAGVAVVSGLARGVDAAAHRGALAAGGRTIAVLGTGFDTCYPRENRQLLEEIASRGLVLTEFPLGMPPEPWHFPVRNRIIAGLSQAVVVVEAGRRSGALITADLALEQGREVMAVPGNITNPLSFGPNWLLKQGARPVTSGLDILEGIGQTLLSGSADLGRPGLDEFETALLALLEGEALTQEEIIQRLKAPAHKVLSVLVYLELKGFVRPLPGGLYARTPRAMAKGETPS